MKSDLSWWQICVIAIVVGFSCILLPVLALKDQLQLPSPPSVREVIDIIAVFVSWPVAVVAVAYRFMNKFQATLDAYLRNIGLMKLPGGFEIQSNQRTPFEVTSSESEKNLVLTPEEQSNINLFITELEQSASLTETAKRDLEQQLDGMASIAIEWKFRFLHQFLVFSTRRVLHWFSQVQPQTRDGYFAIWASVILDEEQRSIILELLLHFGLLIDKDGLIQITDHGFSFLQFVGIIPQTPIAKLG